MRWVNDALKHGHEIAVVVLEDFFCNFANSFVVCDQLRVQLFDHFEELRELVLGDALLYNLEELAAVDWLFGLAIGFFRVKHPLLIRTVVRLVAGFMIKHRDVSCGVIVCLIEVFESAEAYFFFLVQCLWRLVAL